MGKCCTFRVKVGCALGVGVLLACLGAASIPLFEDLYVYMVKKQLVLKVGSESYNNWLSPPAPVYMQFYMFNYTNFDDMQFNQSKPKVQQKGPYSYREIRINQVVEQNPDEITYLQNYSYVFDPSTSCSTCNDSDVFTTPNIPLFTLLHIIKNKTAGLIWPLKGLALGLVNGYLRTEKVTLFNQLSVKQLMWGYNDTFLWKLEKLEKIIANHISLPKIDSVVSLEHNGTAEANLIGNITISTGNKNIDHVQQVLRWRGIDHTNLTYWHTKYGRMLNGTDGSRTKPFLKRHTRLYLFTADLARSLYVEYEKDRYFKNILLYRHTTPDMLFMNSSVNKDNAAFCGPSKCYGTGLLYVGQTQEGNPPILMSSPHFYQGAKWLVDAIDGLHPEKELHGTFLDVEPTTGIVMEAHKRLQVNVLVLKLDGHMSVLKPLKLDENVLPVVWMHEAAVIDDPSADKFKSEVRKPKTYLKVGSYTLLAIGVALVVGIALVLVVLQIKKDNAPYDQMENEETQNDTVQETP